MVSAVTSMKPKNIEVFLLVSSVALSALYYCAWPSTYDVVGLCAFFILAPYFAWSRSAAHSALRTIITSIIYFTFVGLIISNHFGIAWMYGIVIGCGQGLAVGMLVVHANSVCVSSDVWWTLFISVPWVCLTYFISSSYGIAVTLPIQLYRFPMLLQPISAFGTYGIEFVLILSNTSLGVAMHKKSLRSSSLLFVFIILSVWILYAYSLYQGMLVKLSQAPTVRVATISPGSRRQHEYSNIRPEADLISLTQSAVNEQNATFVVWPEVYIRPSDYPFQSCEQYVSNHIASTLNVSAYVVVGCLQRLDDSDCPTANLAIAIDPTGVIIGSYGKQHPVQMIGEKSCIRNGYKMYDIDSKFVASKTDTPTNFKFSTLICYDMDFADSAARVADIGASIVLNPSEDWAAARGHFAASVFRAIENRIAVAKCDWGWDSAIIDPIGRITTMYNSNTMQRQSLVSDVMIEPQTSTRHFRMQHIFPWSFIFICMAYLTYITLDRLRRLEFRTNRDIHTQLLP